MTWISPKRRPTINANPLAAVTPLRQPDTRGGDGAARLRIRGGQALAGRIQADGSKNSALPIITAAALAARGVTVLENVPDFTDIHDLCQILRDLGADAVWEAPGRLRISATYLSGSEAPYGLARKLRGSTYIVGLLLARLGKAQVAVPGGCEIGARPIDFHLKGFMALGARAWVEHGSILAHADRLMGTRIFVDRASFGTTVNLMIAASLADGTTFLENAAKEPEIVDLANFLNAMGGRVRGAGTSQIRIEGVPELHGARHEVIPDRIVAGTYLIGAAITGGDVVVDAVIPEHLRTVLTKLEEAGVQITETDSSIRVRSPRRLKAVDIAAEPHPGFPTDLQSPFLTAMTVADGVSLVQETVFENRFGFVNELVRMGASVQVERDQAIVRGVEALTGAPLLASDIRGGAALVLAGLAAEGETEVAGLQYIDRGYHRIEEKLARLGAGIQRVYGSPG